MRKLLVVLIVFLISIISLVLLFNTFTNSSKQANIKTVSDLPVYSNASERLVEALRIPTIVDSLSHLHFTKFHQWLQKSYPVIFKNPNVEWQTFEQYSLVAKWIGRTPELAPIVLVAAQQTKEPILETIPKWSFNPFMGKIDKGYIHGQGTLDGKTSMIAMLEVLEVLVKKNVLPNRTIYFAFPHDTKQGELAIIQALKEANINPEFVLRTGGLISKDMLWDVSAPAALIGIGHKSVMQATLETKKQESGKIATQELQNLNTALPLIDMEQSVLQEFLSYVSPELGFGQRLVFSNQWLLNNVQQKRLKNNQLTQQLFGNNITANIGLPDTNNTTLTTLTFSSASLKKDLGQWIKSHLQHPQIQLLGQPQISHNNSKIAPINNHAYRSISNSCKEVFPDLITVPILVHEQSSTNWQTNINADIYYFHPVVHNQSSWEKAVQNIDDKISLKNYEQMIQFYYQLLINNI
jgi:carboxypeptidase PM20D1